jgi:hypothetical protein
MAMTHPRVFTWPRVLIAIGGIAITIVFSVWLVRAWRQQAREAVSCQVGFQPLLPKNNPYLEFQFTQQHPIEPYFEGQVFLNLEQSYGNNPVSITLTRSQQRSYGRSVQKLDLHWDEYNKVLWMTDWKRLDQIPRARSHKYFPFDSAEFDFDVALSPAPDLRIIRVSNRARGFIIDCNSVQVRRNSDGSVNVRAVLLRNPLVQLAAVTLIIASIVFLLLIVFGSSAEALPGVVASFFFSLWSIRAILASEINYFPTLLDSCVLTLAAVMIVLLLGRILFVRAFGREGAEPRISRKQK